MLEGCDAPAQSAAYDAATAVAEKAKAAGSEELYFIAKSSDNITGQVRKLTKLRDATASPQMIILDIPAQGGFYVAEGPGKTAVDEAAIAKFVADYKAQKLERKQLG